MEHDHNYHGDDDRDRGEFRIRQALQTIASAIAIGTGLFIASRGIISEDDLDRAIAHLRGELFAHAERSVRVHEKLEARIDKEVERAREHLKRHP